MDSETSIPEEQRTEMLAQEARHLRKAHASRKATETRLKSINKEQCKPPLPEDEVVRIARDPESYLSGTSEREKLEATSSSNRDMPGVLLSEVETQQVHWLWPERIPLRKLTMLDGDPGLGKSMLTLDIAARVTTGRPMPGGTQTVQGGIVLVAPEDGAGDTLRPRLEAAGGDPSQVLLLNTVLKISKETSESYVRTFSIPDDLAILETAINRVKAVLVIIDPLMAVLATDINSFRDQDVRRALTPLGQLAEHTGCAVVIVRHLNKGNAENPLYRGGGSIGIIASARTGLLVARDPDDDSRRVLATIKNNLSKRSSTLTFQIVENEQGVPHTHWLGESNHSVTSLLSSGTNLSIERQTILRALKDSVSPLGPKEIAERTGQDYDSIRLTLSRMHKVGEIAHPYRGKYTTPHHPSITEKSTDKNAHTYATFDTNDTSDTNFMGDLVSNVSYVSDVSVVSGKSQHPATSHWEPTSRTPAEVVKLNSKLLVNCRYEMHHWIYWQPLRKGADWEIICPICDLAARAERKPSPHRLAMYNVMAYYLPLNCETRTAWIERIGPKYTFAV